MALACVVAVVLTSADVGFEALLAQAKLPSREPAAVDPGHTEQLHWGHKWLKSHHYNHPHYWGGAGCEHDFRDLCNENYYHHNVHPFLLHHKWLDGSERLEQAHKFDEEEETAFQEATKELHNKVMVEREDWNAEMIGRKPVQRHKFPSMHDSISFASGQFGPLDAESLPNKLITIPGEQKPHWLPL